MRSVHPILFRLCLRRVLLIPALSITLSLFWLLFSPPAQASFQETWAQFWGGFGRRTPPGPPTNGGGRGPDEPCPIAPFALPDTAIVWSDQPTFVWQGNVEKIAVRLANSENEIWNASVTGLSHIKYTGEALQPNTKYQWLIFTPDYGDVPQRIISFQVMAPQEHTQIAQVLPDVQKEEAIALERAYYFAEQELWSDFWQELFTVEQPSDQLNEFIDQTLTAICQAN